MRGWTRNGLFLLFFAFLLFRFLALILNILSKYYPLRDVYQLRRKLFFAEARRKKNWITNSTAMALFRKGLLRASTDGRRVRHAVLMPGSQCTKTKRKCLFCNTDTKKYAWNVTTPNKCSVLSQLSNDTEWLNSNGANIVKSERNKAVADVAYTAMFTQGLLLQSKTERLSIGQIRHKGG